MEYSQERIATLHDFGGANPSVPVNETAVVVPLTEQDYESEAAGSVFSSLESVDPAQVIVALRATPDDVATITAWLDRFDLSLTVLWCTAPNITEYLDAAGLNGEAGKGRDVWLALGLAGEYEYVVVHDADSTTYSDSHVPRLLFPLVHGYDFSKGYYARIEDNRLYGRLYRLFYTPLVRSLLDRHDHDLLEYLSAFRYGLAGEFALTGDLAREIRAPRGWGLEIGTLGDTFHVAGFDGSAQVDLGIHKHEHRPVNGSDGLSTMCREVANTFFGTLEAAGIEPTYSSLREQYRAVGHRLVDQYQLDAAFNDLDFDSVAERNQVDIYAERITPPPDDTRLPAWTESELEASEIASLSEQALDRLQPTI